MTDEATPTQAAPEASPASAPVVEATPSSQPTPSETASSDGQPKGEATSDPNAQPSSEPGSSESDELDPETLDSIASLYKDNLLERDAFKQEVERRVRETADQRVREQTRIQQAGNEVNAIITRGQQAANWMAGRVNAATDALSKAQAGEEFDPNALNPAQFAGGLRDFGESLVAATERSIDTALETAVDQIFGPVLPPLSEQGANDLATLANTAERMRNDPAQGPDRARSYFITGLMRMVVQQSYQHGRLEERQLVEGKRTLSDKIASSNAIKAARAKLEAERNPPPSPSNQPGESTAGGGNTMAEYRAAKLRGDKAEADRIARDMSATRYRNVPFVRS